MNAELSEDVALVAEEEVVCFGNEKTELPVGEPNGTCGEVAVPNIEARNKTKTVLSIRYHIIYIYVYICS